jgi:hypothetical protein
MSFSNSINGITMERYYTNNRKYKAMVLGNLTNDNPGVLVRHLQSQCNQLTIEAHRRQELELNLKKALDDIQEWWGLNFGSEESPENQRNLKLWCQHLLELEAKKQEWTLPAAMLDPTTALYQEWWRVGGVTGFCKLAFDEVHNWQGWPVEQWEWLIPRPTLVRWCYDILEMIEERENATAKRRKIHQRLWNMGWDWELNMWRDGSDPIWEYLNGVKENVPTGHLPAASLSG